MGRTENGPTTHSMLSGLPLHEQSNPLERFENGGHGQGGLGEGGSVGLEGLACPTIQSAVGTVWVSLELGRHGIYIKRGWASGCFLPQVATETGWSKEEFLSQCCGGKASLPSDAWKDAETEVYLFTAEVFGEAQLGRG